MKEEIWAFDNWGVKFGKMEACLARLDISPATPVKNAETTRSDDRRALSSLSKPATRHLPLWLPRSSDKH